MTNTASPASPAPSPAAHAPTPRRSQTLDAAITRGQSIAAALPPLLAGIAKADAGAAKVRIDAAWVTNLNGVIAQAEQAQGGRAVAKVAQKAATAEERQQGLSLSLLLTQVRERVATHNPDDLAAQQAYGRGEKIDPTRTGALLAVAQGYLAAWTGEWQQPAADAGVTQATIDQIGSLASSLTQANVKQQSKMKSGAQGTLDRDAALAALRTLSAFAVRVVTSVYGKGSREADSLTDTRPVAGKVVALKKATQAKKKVAAKATSAKKAAARAKPGAKSKSRARKVKHVLVATRAAALVARKKAPAKAAKKAAKKAAPAKKAKKKR